jgi:hypothetical protein
MSRGHLALDIASHYLVEYLAASESLHDVKATSHDLANSESYKRDSEVHRAPIQHSL